MLVYRIEHKQDGKGPYLISDTRPESVRRFVAMLSDRHDNSPNHPEPLDHAHIMKYWHYCAFESLDQLCAWFSQEDEIVGLAEHGFVCKVYDVPLLLHRSRFQVVFNMDDAEFVMDLPLS